MTLNDVNDIVFSSGKYRVQFFIVDKQAMANIRVDRVPRLLEAITYDGTVK